MVRVKKTTPAPTTVLEEGIYEAEFKRTEEVNIPKYGDRIRWVFEVEDEEEGTVEVSGLTSTIFNERSKAYRWAKALGYDERKHGEDFDLDDLAGAKCIVKIENRETGSGATISNVVDVIAKKKKKKVDEL